MTKSASIEEFSPKTVLEDLIGERDESFQALAEHLAWERALKYLKQRRSFELSFVRDVSRLEEINLAHLNGEISLKEAGGFYNLKATFRDEIGS